MSGGGGGDEGDKGSGEAGGAGGDEGDKGMRITDAQYFDFAQYKCPMPHAQFQDICGLRRCQVVDCS